MQSSYPSFAGSMIIIHKGSETLRPEKHVQSCCKLQKQHVKSVTLIPIMKKNTNNELVEEEIRKNRSLTMASKDK